MLIDLHFHTKIYSSCSKIDLEEGVIAAKKIGLDAICLTEHDIIATYPNIDFLEKKYGLKIFTGVEIYSKDGDILCYGIDELPKERLSASELVDYVKANNGATIAAHPFRVNNRGIKDLISTIPLDAVEAFNGNTSYENNMKAYDICMQKNIPITSASDCHSLEKVGLFATKFENDNINTVNELAREIRMGRFGY